MELLVFVSSLTPSLKCVSPMNIAPIFITCRMYGNLAGTVKNFNLIDSVIERGKDAGLVRL